MVVQEAKEDNSEFGDFQFLLAKCQEEKSIFLVRYVNLSTPRG